jgi:putative exporter of polyketide antibiotics
MLWWFLILAFSAGAVLWVGIALYLRVRRHMKASHAELKELPGRTGTTVSESDLHGKTGNSKSQQS